MDPALPSNLSAAIGTEPVWLRTWVMALVVTNLSAVVFVVKRESGRFGVRPEPIAIVASFVAAAVFMDWLYASVGYVRLLGLAHLLFWGPVWGWLLSRRAEIGGTNAFGMYVHAYLVVAGISLAIDGLDVVRYLVGDGALLHRWQ